MSNNNGWFLIYIFECIGKGLFATVCIPVQSCYENSHFGNIWPKIIDLFPIAVSLLGSRATFASIISLFSLINEVKGQDL